MPSEIHPIVRQLRKARERANLSQNQVDELAGLTKGTMGELDLVDRLRADNWAENGPIKIEAIQEIERLRDKVARLEALIDGIDFSEGLADA